MHAESGAKPKERERVEEKPRKRESGAKAKIERESGAKAKIERESGRKAKIERERVEGKPKERLVGKQNDGDERVKREEIERDEGKANMVVKLKQKTKIKKAYKNIR